MRDRQQRRMVVGGALIVVGLTFFVRSHFDALESEYLLLGLGVVFLIAYLWFRRYGLMVPAGVLLGLGCGELLEDRFAGPTEWSQLSLGFGFLLVFLVPWLVERRSHWWPIIPAGILLLSAVERTDEVLRTVFEHWPLLLVLVGVALFVAGWLDARNRDSTEAVDDEFDG